MIITINQQGPTNVSNHIKDSRIINVVDLRFSKFMPNEKLPFENSLTKNPGVSYHLSPYTTPKDKKAFHIEVLQFH